MENRDKSLKKWNYRVCTLVSGSSGNSFYIENEDTAILVDAGISGAQFTNALKKQNLNPDKIKAIILTHDHSDHVYGAGVIHRKHNIPLYMTKGTYEKIADKIGKIQKPVIFKQGSKIQIERLNVNTFGTPHDAVEPVAVIIECNNAFCGILTDLGCPFPSVVKLVPKLDAVFLESNYDPEMLENGPYNANLKNRIKSFKGHISNIEAGNILKNSIRGRLKQVVFSHLSDKNNHPDLVENTIFEIAGDVIKKNNIKILIAPRYEPSEFIYL